MGHHDFSWEGTNIPEQITCLTSTLNPCTYDLSGMGPGPDVAGNDDERYDDDLDFIPQGMQCTAWRSLCREGFRFGILQEQARRTF